MSEMGANAQEIDLTVRYNDAPALDELHVLSMTL